MLRQSLWFSWICQSLYTIDLVLRVQDVALRQREYSVLDFLKIIIGATQIKYTKDTPKDKIDKNQRL